MIHKKTSTANNAPLVGSRRRFLLGAVSVAVTPLITDAFGQTRLTSGALPAPTGTDASLEVYRQFIGGAFTEVGSGHGLILANIEPMTNRRQPCKMEQFSLFFVSLCGKEIESRIYEMQHPELGRVDLFLSPVGSCVRFGGLQKGEAVISRLLAIV